MINDVEKILFTEEQLRRRVEELGEQLTADYAGKSPVLVSVLRGSYIFMADLTRQVKLPITMDRAPLAPARWRLRRTCPTPLRART